MVKLQLKDVASVKKAVVKDMVMVIVILRRIVQDEMYNSTRYTSLMKAVVMDMVMVIVIMRRIVQGESEDDGIDVERFTYSEVGLIQYINIRK